MKLKLRTAISLSILALALFIKYMDFPVIQQLQLGVFDSYQINSPREYTSQPIKIIDIDDESLSRIGQWPWPRDELATLVDKLAEAGATSVAFDMVFAEPDRLSNRNDGIFSTSIKNAGNVVTGFTMTHEIRRSKPEVKAGISYTGADPKKIVEDFRGTIVNLPEIENAAKGNGTFNSSTDRDGIIRKMPLFFRAGNKLYPSLVAESLRVAQGASTYIIKSSGASGELDYGDNSGIVAVKIGAFEIPTDSVGRFWVHYTDFTPERYIPAWRILSGKFKKEDIEGNIIFIGTSAAGLKDVRSTPLNPAVSGVEVHTQALEQILSGNFLTRPDWIHGAEALLMIVIGITLIIALTKLPALWGAGITLATLAVIAGFSAYQFNANGLLLDPITLTIVVILIYLSESLGRFINAEKERKQIRDAFSFYMSPALVKELAKNPDKLKLGGEEKNLTVLFCDIRDFTGISENLNASELTHFMNKFLTPMTDIILDNRGTIDKYMGDCIMAFWNAPLNVPKHPYKACLSALAMMGELKEFNARQKQEAKENKRKFVPTKIGIGINTGDCSVGNMGSDQRFDYSVLGDDVNLSSRLEGQSKTYGVDIVLGPKTKEKAGNLATLELDIIRVKGKKKPVRIFALLGDKKLAKHESFMDLDETFTRMLSLYRKKKWKEASSLLKECEKLNTMIKAVDLKILLNLYAERIKTFTKKPPPKNWNGVYEAKTK